ATLKDLRLFISEPIPLGFWSPLAEPSLEELSHPKIFQSIPIPILKGKSRMDLGDVVVANRYAKVIVELRGMSFQKDGSGSNKLIQTRLTLLDNHRRVIFSGILPSQAFDPAAR